MKDSEMFQNLVLSFDLANGKVTVETASKDFHGLPYYQYIYDTHDNTAVELTNFDNAQPVPEQVSLPPQAEQPEPEQSTPAPNEEASVPAAAPEQSTPVPNEEASVPAASPEQSTPVPYEASSVTASDGPAEVKTLIPGQETVDKVLTPEEQREVAFKVVAFFIMLVIASFSLLYITHRCSQKDIKSPAHKKTL